MASSLATPINTDVQKRGFALLLHAGYGERSAAKKVFLIMGLLKRIFRKKPTSSNDLGNNSPIYGGDAKSIKSAAIINQRY